jgi:hypothetical protein
MRIIQLLWLLAFVVAVAGEVCQKRVAQSSTTAGVLQSLISGPSCSFDGLIIANVTFDTAGTPPPPPPARPPPPPSRPPPTQPAGDGYWTSCKNRGCTFTFAMDARDSQVGPSYDPQRDTGASPYQSPDDLRKWYWFRFPDNRIDDNFRDFYTTW